MICRKCSYKNPTQSWYCYQCGTMFTAKEKETARNSGFVGFLKRLRNAYDTLTFSKITSNKYFRIASILVVLGIGIWGILIHGHHFKIVESDYYSYQYNKQLDEYYLYTKDNETKVNLYKLGKVDTLDVSYYNENNDLISSDTYLLDEIVLQANILKDCYYILNSGQESIKIYVYQEFLY